jgi:hypothetical protein
MVEINIRLDRRPRYFTDAQLEQRAETAIGVLRNMGTVDHRVRNLGMDRSRVLIAQVHVDEVSYVELVNLAIELSQDCLSIYYPSTNEGHLVGPLAHEWQPFDLEAFERFDDALNPKLVSVPRIKYEPPEDAEVLRAQMQAMYSRLRRVFTEEVLGTFAHQQVNMTERAINRILQEEGPQALTVPRFEGVYELVTVHLWSDALTSAMNSAHS